MERIRFTKTEKKCLQLLNKYGADSLDTIARSQVCRALRSLEEKDMVRIGWIEGGDYEAVSITRSGRVYLIENPKLCNPIDWKWIISITIGIATLAVAIIALFVACNR